LNKLMIYQKAFMSSYIAEINELFFQVAYLIADEFRGSIIIIEEADVLIKTLYIHNLFLWKPEDGISNLQDQVMGLCLVLYIIQDIFNTWIDVGVEFIFW